MKHQGRNAHLISIHHYVVCSDERFEDHNPAAVGGSFKQSVGQLGHVHIHLIGAVDQVWKHMRHMLEQHASLIHISKGSKISHKMHQLTAWTQT